MICEYWPARGTPAGADGRLRIILKGWRWPGPSPTLPHFIDPPFQLAVLEAQSDSVLLRPNRKALADGLRMTDNPKTYTPFFGAIYDFYSEEPHRIKDTGQRESRTLIAGSVWSYTQMDKGNGTCFAKIENIGQKVRRSRATAKRHLHALEADGLIQCTKRGAGRNSRSVYEITSKLQNIIDRVAPENDEYFDLPTSDKRSHVDDSFRDESDDQEPNKRSHLDDPFIDGNGADKRGHLDDPRGTIRNYSSLKTKRNLRNYGLESYQEPDPKNPISPKEINAKIAEEKRNGESRPIRDGSQKE